MIAALSVSAKATILLNEIHFRTPATTDTLPADGNFEFVELKSTTGGVELCTNLWILVIENDGGGVGEIEQAWPHLRRRREVAIFPAGLLGRHVVRGPFRQGAAVPPITESSPLRSRFLGDTAKRQIQGFTSR